MPVTVNLIRELSGDFKVGEFEFKAVNTGFQQKILFEDKPLQIIMKNADLNLDWKIIRDWENKSSLDQDSQEFKWIWKKIMLERCDLEVIVKLRIDVDGYIFLEETINTALLPYVKDNLKIVYAKNSTLKMLVEVYQEDKSLKQQLKNYQKFLENKKFHDVKFYVKHKPFPAHMDILSAESPVFKSMFDSDMWEKNNGEVSISDIEPKIFKDLLKFIYHGKVESSDVDDLLKLLVAADKYCMSNLMSICKDEVSRKLSSECVIDALITADLLKANILKKKCMNFIFEQKDSVVKTDAYKKFVKSHPYLLSELFCEIKYTKC